MTSETRTYIELEDIIAIEFPCHSCGTTVAIPLRATEKAVSAPKRCPNCANDLIHTRDVERIEGLVRTLRHAADKELGLFSTLRLQVHTPKEPAK
jgi:predicted RNA-binding Zn-ribbon protein involved in translation (DUF1610 family)